MWSEILNILNPYIATIKVIIEEEKHDQHPSDPM